MIARTIEAYLQQIFAAFPVTAIVGPRQSGKTMLAQALFPLPYTSLEDPDTREIAETDTRRFLEQYPNGCIIDEAQRVPQLFSYLQGYVDARRTAGQYVLTGSSNFLMMRNISQSLAGRVGIATLLPFSLEELHTPSVSNSVPETTVDATMLRGFYPPLYNDAQRQTEPRLWLSNYITTYIERDVRLLQNITDLRTFTTFLRLCAARTGQILNYTALAADCGISPNTVKQWLSVLEASYILFFVQPFHQNFGKRLIKMPKMYFHDVALAAYLLGIRSEQEIATHSARGALMETMIIGEIYKYFTHRGETPPLSYWRDKTGHEIDLIIETPQTISAVEIKSAHTFDASFFASLTYFRTLANIPPENGFVIYGGTSTMQRTQGMSVSWRDTVRIINKEIPQ
jgi:hypothetical protein